jgi:hypothetical protein
MYGKIFTSIYNSTLMSDHGWLGVYVFSSMIVLADQNGVVDMDPTCLYRQLGLDEFDEEKPEFFKKFLETIDKLEAPDEGSNIGRLDGRRIVALRDIEDISDNRGWLVVNYDHYRKKGSHEERNEYKRGYMAAIRKLSKNNNDVKQRETVCNGVNNVKHTDTDTDTDKTPPTPSRGEAYMGSFLKFWEIYPKKVGKKAAWRSWKNAKIKDLDSVVRAVHVQTKSDQWLKDGGQFIPNPATWLNQGRWDDEAYQPTKRKEKTCAQCGKGLQTGHVETPAGPVCMKCKYGR